MLSIVVNDALTGIDIMTKYPTFYARMLADKDLRTAFLETLELLELSWSGNLPDFAEPLDFNLDFLNDMRPEPVFMKLGKHQWQLNWYRPAAQLLKIFKVASLLPEETSHQNDWQTEKNHTTLLQGLLEIEDEDIEIRLDIAKAADDSGTLNLTFIVFASAKLVNGLEATVVWGNYMETIELDDYGFARFPPLKNKQIFDQAGRLIHDLECCLKTREQA